MKGRQAIKNRQKSALELLKKQLEKGTKPKKIDGKTINEHIPLSVNDKERIDKEIEKLKKHVI